MGTESVRFGAYEFFPEQRLLVSKGERIPLGARALAILDVLVASRGQTVSHRRLVSEVWPDTFVEESSLRVHIASLRKALGDGQDGNRFIVNEPGRGYVFTAAVESATIADGPPLPAPRLAAAYRPPILLTSLIGRTEAIRALLDQMSKRRLITVVGAGGIGKTSMVLTAAQAALPRFLDGICFVDLATISTGAQLPSLLASSLRLAVPAQGSVEALTGSIEALDLCLILDNCEHVIDAAAEAAEILLRACPAIVIVATSREPLRAEGEIIQHLTSLESAPADLVAEPAVIARYAAVQLFAERADASLGGFRIGPDNARLVADLCRRLDGMPLAIELAAAALPSIGLKGLLAGIDDRLTLLRGGRRGHDRHQTLRAMLDWSYASLTGQEQFVFERLSVFQVPFSLEGALAVLVNGAIDRRGAIDCLMSLVSKSLIAADLSHDEAEYRILETTRMYGRERLLIGENGREARTLHGRYILGSLKEAEHEWAARSQHELWDRQARRVEDLRAAIAWAFSEDGDAPLGVDLLTASAPLWLSLSKVEEYGRLIRANLERLNSQSIAGTPAEVRLNLVLGGISFNVSGPGPEHTAALDRALATALALKDVSAQMWAWWSRMGIAYPRADYAGILSIAKALAELTASSPSPEATGMTDRIHSVAHFRSGDLALARHYGDLSVGRTHKPERASRGNFVYQHPPTAKANLSNILWVQGLGDQARTLIEDAVDMAVATKDPSTLCFILSFNACPLALWLGDRDLVGRYCDLLHRQAEHNGFLYMLEWAVRYRAIAAARWGSDPVASHVLGQHFAELGTFQRQTFVTVLPALVDERTYGEAATSGPNWATAEILRAWGERQAALGRTDAATTMGNALDIASRQGALAFELRAATSLFSLLGDDISRTRLAGTVSRMIEGFGTEDYLRATQLLAE